MSVSATFSGAQSVKRHEYTPADIIVQDDSGNTLVISLAQPFVFRLSRVGPLAFLEIEMQLTLVVNAAFFTIFVPVEFNPKDKNSVSLINCLSPSAGPKIANVTNLNVVNPTPPAGVNPVTLFIEVVTTGANFPAFVQDFFGFAMWTSA